MQHCALAVKNTQKKNDTTKIFFYLSFLAGSYKTENDKNKVKNCS